MDINTEVQQSLERVIGNLVTTNAGLSAQLKAALQQIDELKNTKSDSKTSES